MRKNFFARSIPAFALIIGNTSYYPTSFGNCNSELFRIITINGSKFHIHEATYKILFSFIYEFLKKYEGKRKDLAKEMKSKPKLYRFICSFADYLKNRINIACSPHMFAIDSEGHSRCVKCGASADEVELCDAIDEMVSDVESYTVFLDKENFNFNVEMLKALVNFLAGASNTQQNTMHN